MLYKAGQLHITLYVIALYNYIIYDFIVRGLYLYTYIGISETNTPIYKTGIY